MRGTMKETYEALEMEVILFCREDVITASDPTKDIELPEVEG